MLLVCATGLEVQAEAHHRCPSLCCVRQTLVELEPPISGMVLH